MCKKTLLIKVSYLAVFLCCSLIGLSQDLIIDLYEGTPPYSTGVRSEESWIGHRVTNVQIPQLYVYKPQAEKNTGVTVIYCPGGGYGRLSIPDMGKGYGRFFNEFGVTVIILKYRLPVSQDLELNHLVPMTDVTQAIRKVKDMADELEINPDKVGIMGGSAGGHLASMISTQFNQQSPLGVSTLQEPVDYRPDFTILVYPVISMDTAIAHMGSRRNLLGKNPEEELVKKYSTDQSVTTDTPPTFLVHGTNDASVSVINSTRYYEALVKNNVPVEMHIFQDGKHGAGFGKKGQPWSAWTSLCKTWMLNHVIE